MCGACRFLHVLIRRGKKGKKEHQPVKPVACRLRPPESGSFPSTGSLHAEEARLRLTKASDFIRHTVTRDFGRCVPLSRGCTGRKEAKTVVRYENYGGDYRLRELHVTFYHFLQFVHNIISGMGRRRVVEHSPFFCDKS